MKKTVFILLMAVAAVAVMLTTPTEDLIEDFQLDDGMNKLVVAVSASVLSLAGAVLDIRRALIALIIGIVLMGCLCGVVPMFIFGCQFAVARLMADDEIKDFILTPLKDE